MFREALVANPDFDHQKTKAEIIDESSDENPFQIYVELTRSALPEEYEPAARAAAEKAGKAPRGGDGGASAGSEKLAKRFKHCYA